MKKNSWKRDFKEASNGIELIQKHMKVAIPLYSQEEYKFHAKIPASFISRINPEDPLDPLLLQVMDPLKDKVNLGIKDPLNEQAFSHQGLIQKYKSRALIVTTQACPIHCRYCFRQHFPYDKNIASKDHYSETVKLIASDINLKEVILSGGDPLSLSDNKLGQLINSIDRIKHINTIRVHTRFPIAIPSRINDSLINIFKSLRARLVIVIHCNHPNELNEEVKEVLLTLSRIHNLTLLNQSVLLKNINDSHDTLLALSHKLFNCGVLPYYLHLLDPVLGSEHFQVELNTIKILYKKLMGELPGYLLPRLVKEVPGESSKIPFELLDESILNDLYFKGSSTPSSAS